MAVTSASLRANNPEFTNTPEAIVLKAIGRAERELDATAWGNLLDDGVELLACHYIANTPAGEAAQLINEDGNTSYLLDWKRLDAKINPSV